MLDKIVNFFLVNATIVLPLAMLVALVVSSTARRGLKVLLRITARLLLIAAVVALVYDGTRTMAGGSGLVITSFAEHWAHLAPKALAASKAFVDANIHALAWSGGVERVIRLPAWLVLGVLGLLLIWLGQPKRKVGIFIN